VNSLIAVPCITIPATGAVFKLAGSLLAESEKITVLVVGVIVVWARAGSAKDAMKTSNGQSQVDAEIPCRPQLMRWAVVEDLIIVTFPPEIVVSGSFFRIAEASSVFRATRPASDI
jgi:hypothetical protein